MTDAPTAPGPAAEVSDMLVLSHGRDHRKAHNRRFQIHQETGEIRAWRGQCSNRGQRRREKQFCQFLPSSSRSHSAEATNSNSYRGGEQTVVSSLVRRRLGSSRQRFISAKTAMSSPSCPRTMAGWCSPMSPLSFTGVSPTTEPPSAPAMPKRN